MTRFRTWDEVAEEIKKFQNNDVKIYHEITWWLERELTLEEWDELDRRQYKIFEDMNIDVSGVAGPIPEIGEENDKRN